MNAAATQGLEALQPTLHGSWGPRRALTLNAARRRSAIVRMLRWGFIAAAGAILLTLLVQLILSGQGGEAVTEEAVSADVRMINPRFTGRDENLKPYTVTADLAVRRRDSRTGLTELERPRLEYDFLNTADDTSEVLAQSGVYDPENRILDLNSQVDLSTDTGYTFRSEHARVFLREERVEGDLPVEGTGPMGDIRSDRFEIRDAGNLVIFEGNVRARIVQDRTRTDAGESE